MKTASTNQDHFQGFSPLNYTQAPDQFFDEIAPFLKEAELKAMLYIIRRTFGFKKQTDNISLNQMLNGIVKKDGVRIDFGVGVKKKALLKALTSLEDKCYIVRSRNKSAKRGNECTTYSLNIANSTPPGVQKTPRVGDQKTPRARYPKDTIQETVKQETVLNSNRSKIEKNVDKSSDNTVSKSKSGDFKRETEDRGGGFKSFSEIMEIRKQKEGEDSKIPPDRLPNDAEVLKTSQDDRISVLEKTSRKTPLREPTKLDAVMVKISQDIGDTKHERENIKQAKNIFFYPQKEWGNGRSVY